MSGIAGMAGGGMSASSSASGRSGNASSGAGSVNVGGFNPPAFGGGGNQSLVLLGVMAIAAVVLIKWIK